MELSQIVWQRSIELADSVDELDLSDGALVLLRTARHDTDTMNHALGLGHSRAHRYPSDETTRRGIRLLQRAIAFLGAPVDPDEIAKPRATMKSRGFGAPKSDVEPHLLAGPLVGLRK